MPRNRLLLILVATLVMASLQACSNRSQGPAASPTAPSSKSYEEYINDSLAFYNAGEYQKSVEAGQTALQLQPRSAVAYNNICAAYNQLKQFDKAVEACAQALLIQPDFALAKGNALQAAQGAGMMPAGSYEAYINESLKLHNAGEYQKSIEAAQGALLLKPDSAVAYNNICAAYNELKQWDKAIEACQKALAIAPDLQRAKNNLRVAQQGKQ
jgi:protein O-mannosyl-transferase